MGDEVLAGREQWTEEEMLAEFDVRYLLGPCAFVTRKRDGARGSLLVEGRYPDKAYHGWKAEPHAING